MNKKSSLNNLLYIQEHRSCRNYLEKVENGFKYIEFSHEEVILEKEISWNYLLFVLEGECVINCNQFRERLFQANCMVLLPKTAMVEIKVIAGTRLLSLSFDVPLNVCDKFILQSLTGLCTKAFTWACHAGSTTISAEGFILLRSQPTLPTTGISHGTTSPNHGEETISEVSSTS